MNPNSYPKFSLGEKITAEQKSFFDENGFIHFEGVATAEEVQAIIESTEKIQEKWISDGVKKINGVPIKYGVDENNKQIVHRFPFTSNYSEPIHKFVNSNRVSCLKVLLPEGARIAENEKDGVIFNHYVNTPMSNFRQMGWHTDSMRDIFYGKKVLPMLNVGLYLDSSSSDKGGLRIIPGTHKQNMFSMLFKKAYFLNNDEDKNEMLVDAKAGDMVVHDGRIWHRVAMSPHMGAASRRRVMYIPIILGKFMPKDESSSTPFYHHFQKLVK
ncbi:MAG: phytanoyl-CoA dioxygenase [Bacteroidetes bacterium]|nr:MAG: phytanoyl-CoA dioxygenase [Bacteroidota bacterium]REJ99769.1 MAG: phytanoyl-CoA dioxygenase [Bacteroidota bacterium]REK34142.1 MAG: phytanoyl-CoA dioxygenase [Bacteroidota bacterium]REK50472.1 MAG: phytanoyl-CoA dioxygenase [Bacteroidota bacterium]